MTRHVITGNYGSYRVETFKDVWLFKKDFVIDYDGFDGTAFVVSGQKNSIFFNGHIDAPSSAMDIYATNILEIGVKATIFGAVQFGPNVEVINRGLISYDVAYGALRGGSSDDMVTNHGQIMGHVVLAGGDDTFRFRDGAISGEIRGGMGDDTLVTNEGSIKLTEVAGEGYDTVKSSDDYILPVNVEALHLTGKKNLEGIGNAGVNYLQGNKGDNILRGGDSGDYLNGGKGNDRLHGEGGLDMFFFGTGGGKDRIMDFEDGDVINLGAWDGIARFAAVKRHAEDRGDNVWITEGKDTLIIVGVSKSELQSDWFSFD